MTFVVFAAVNEVIIDFSEFFRRVKGEFRNVTSSNERFIYFEMFYLKWISNLLLKIQPNALKEQIHYKFKPSFDIVESNNPPH